MKTAWMAWMMLAGWGAGAAAAEPVAAVPSPAAPAVSATVAATVWTPEVRVGFTREQVLAALGHPSGAAQVNDEWEILFYERGKVDLTHGRVTNVELISPEDLARRKTLAERAWQEYQKTAAARRIQARQEGERLKQRMLNDPDFLASSFADQAAGWRTFMLSYPDVPVGTLYQDALDKAREEEARMVESRRLAELEARTAAAEARAAEAERKAEQARNTITFPPYYVYPYPVPVQPRPPQPPCPPGSGSHIGVTGSTGAITVHGQAGSTSRLPNAGTWPYNFGGTRSTIRLGQPAIVTNSPPRR